MARIVSKMLTVSVNILLSTNPKNLVQYFLIMCLTCKVLLSRLRPNDIIFMSLLKPDIITIFDFDMKKLNATSNPMEAVATTAFESLDDMAWLNGLQVKFISYESDVIMNSLHSQTLRRRLSLHHIFTHTKKNFHGTFK